MTFITLLIIFFFPIIILLFSTIWVLYSFIIFFSTIIILFFFIIIIFCCFIILIIYIRDIFIDGSITNNMETCYKLIISPVIGTNSMIPKFVSRLSLKTYLEAKILKCIV